MWPLLLPRASRSRACFAILPGLRSRARRKFCGEEEAGASSRNILAGEGVAVSMPCRDMFSESLLIDSLDFVISWKVEV